MGTARWFCLFAFLLLLFMHNVYTFVLIQKSFIIQNKCIKWKLAFGVTRTKKQNKKKKKRKGQLDVVHWWRRFPSNLTSVSLTWCGLFTTLVLLTWHDIGFIDLTWFIHDLGFIKFGHGVGFIDHGFINNMTSVSLTWRGFIDFDVFLIDLKWFTDDIGFNDMAWFQWLMLFLVN